MRELVEYLVRSLVEHPDEVEVEEFDEDGDLVLEVSVADDDLGRVIGRGGRIGDVDERDPPGPLASPREPVGRRRRQTDGESERGGRSRPAASRMLEAQVPMTPPSSLVMTTTAGRGGRFGSKSGQRVEGAA